MRGYFFSVGFGRSWSWFAPGLRDGPQPKASELRMNAINRTRRARLFTVDLGLPSRKRLSINEKSRPNRPASRDDPAADYFFSVLAAGLALLLLPQPIAEMVRAATIIAQKIFFIVALLR